MRQSIQLGARPQFLTWTTLAYLEAAYPGQARLTTIQTAQALGISDKHVRNLLSLKKFYIPNVGEPGRPSFRKVDVAAYIDGRVDKKNVGGSPTKAERIAAREAGLSVPEWRKLQEQKGGVA